MSFNIEFQLNVVATDNFQQPAKTAQKRVTIIVTRDSPTQFTVQGLGSTNTLRIIVQETAPVNTTINVLPSQKITASDVDLEVRLLADLFCQ